jgi:hypothetical protein
VIGGFGKLLTALIDVIDKMASWAKPFIEDVTGWVRQQFESAAQSVGGAGGARARELLERARQERLAGEKTGLTMAGGATFDPRQLIQRITEKALASDYVRQTADNTKTMSTTLRDMLKFIEDIARKTAEAGARRVPENA